MAGGLAADWTIGADAVGSRVVREGGLRRETGPRAVVSPSWPRVRGDEGLGSGAGELESIRMRFCVDTVCCRSLHDRYEADNGVVKRRLEGLRFRE